MARLGQGRLHRACPTDCLCNTAARMVGVPHPGCLRFEASRGAPVPAAPLPQGLDSQDVTPRGSASAWQGAGGQSASFTAGYGNGSSGLYSGGSGPLQQGNGQMVSGGGLGGLELQYETRRLPVARQAQPCVTSCSLGGHVSVLTKRNNALQEQGGTGAMRGAGGGGGLLHGYGSGSSMSEAAAAASPGGVLSVRRTWQVWHGASQPGRLLSCTASAWQACDNHCSKCTHAHSPHRGYCTCVGVFLMMRLFAHLSRHVAAKCRTACLPSPPTHPPRRGGGAAGRRRDGRQGARRAAADPGLQGQGHGDGDHTRGGRREATPQRNAVGMWEHRCDHSAVCWHSCSATQTPPWAPCSCVLFLSFTAPTPLDTPPASIPLHFHLHYGTHTHTGGRRAHLLPHQPLATCTPLCTSICLIHQATLACHPAQLLAPTTRRGLCS